MITSPTPPSLILTLTFSNPNPENRIADQIQVIRRFASADSSDLTQTPNPSPNLSPNPP